MHSLSLDRDAAPCFCGGQYLFHWWSTGLLNRQVRTCVLLFVVLGNRLHSGGIVWGVFYVKHR